MTYKHARATARYTVRNPRKIPATFPVLELADGRQFFEGDEIRGADLSPKALDSWTEKGILEEVDRG